MKFSTKEDINVPIEAVFEMLSDFERFEQAAMQRGAQVQCLNRTSPAQVGMTWKAAFDMRGKQRDLTIGLVTLDKPEEIVLESTSQGLVGYVTLVLIALSRSQTRLHVTCEVKPQNLSARLLVQSFKLAKTSLTQKYKERVAAYARVMEDRYGRKV